LGAHRNEFAGATTATGFGMFLLARLRFSIAQQLIHQLPRAELLFRVLALALKAGVLRIVLYRTIPRAAMC
jgi:hypothetical protein